MSLVMFLAIGMMLGVAYFGGLWWTVNHGIRSENPGTWFVTSFLLRMALLLGCFNIVMHYGWQSAAACALGVVAGRVVLTARS